MGWDVLERENVQLLYLSVKCPGCGNTVIIGSSYDVDIIEDKFVECPTCQCSIYNGQVDFHIQYRKSVRDV